MSFITQWIESFMDDPETVVKENNETRKRASVVSKQLITRIDQPHRVSKSWKNPWFRAGRRRDAVFSGADGKQSKYLATSTSRANSYESVLEFYDKKQAELDTRK
jgi:hypothetical protein